MTGRAGERVPASTLPYKILLKLVLCNGVVNEVAIVQKCFNLTHLSKVEQVMHMSSRIQLPL